MKFTSFQERAPSTERRPSAPRADGSRWKRRLAWPSLWIAGKLIRRDALVVFNYHQVSPVFDPARHFAETWPSLVDFERAVEHLQRSNRLLRLPEGFRLLQPGTLRGIVVALSFDGSRRRAGSGWNMLKVMADSGAWPIVSSRHVRDYRGL